MDSFGLDRFAFAARIIQHRIAEFGLETARRMAYEDIVFHSYCAETKAAIMTAFGK